MAKKIETPENPQPPKGRVMVRALVPMFQFGWGHFQGSEFEVSDELAKQWVEMRAVELC